MNDTIKKCPQELIDCGHALTDIARPLAYKAFNSPMEVDFKESEGPVTVTDRLIEEKIREYLSKHRPDDGVLGEEYGHTNPEAEWQWVIDPIDGTAEFIAGTPTFSALVGLMRGDQFVMGLCDQPMLERRWIGAVGYDTTFNGQTMRIRKDRPDKEWVVCCTNPLRYEGKVFDFLKQWHQENAHLHCGGSTKFCQLASGWIDCVFSFPGYGVWDIAPFVPIVNGAGGHVKTIEGKDYYPDNDKVVIAYGDERVWQYIVDNIGETG